MARRLPENERQRNLVVLGIQQAIQGSFSDSDWKELGYRTGTREWIDNHPRLIRSLRWNDDDYGGHVLDAIEHILEEDPANLDALLENSLIADWLSRNNPSVLAALDGSTPSVPLPALAVTSDSVERALREAEVLINSTGPSSAVDRVHTALHGYLLAVCDAAGVPYNPDPSITELFKTIHQNHPAFQNLGVHSSQIVQILRTFSSIVHVVNELRNRASTAHPNPSVLGPDEALVVINATRTLFAYLNAKISS